MVTYVTAFAVSDHWTSFKVNYKVLGTTHTRSTIVWTETPPYNWRVSWRMADNTPAVYSNRISDIWVHYGLRSNLRAPNLKIISTEACPCLRTHHHQCSLPTPSIYLPPRLCTAAHAHTHTHTHTHAIRQWKNDYSNRLYCYSYLVCARLWSSLGQHILLRNSGTIQKLKW